MNTQPTKGQIVKTKAGDKTWRVLRVVDGDILLEGVTNFKFKRLAIDQFNKSWKVVEA